MDDNYYFLTKKIQAKGPWTVHKIRSTEKLKKLLRGNAFERLSKLTPCFKILTAAELRSLSHDSFFKINIGSVSFGFLNMKSSRFQRYWIQAYLLWNSKAENIWTKEVKQNTKYSYHKTSKCGQPSRENEFENVRRGASEPTNRTGRPFWNSSWVGILKINCSSNFFYGSTGLLCISCPLVLVRVLVHFHFNLVSSVLVPF